MRLSTNFRKNKASRKVIRHLKAVAQRSREVKDIFEEHMQGKADLSISAAFNALKNYRAHR